MCGCLHFTYFLALVQMYLVGFGSGGKGIVYGKRSCVPISLSVVFSKILCCIYSSGFFVSCFSLVFVDDDDEIVSHRRGRFS